MCRLAAYLGPEITLSAFLQTHEHSLVKQSWAPQEMKDGTLNADGYGVAWLADNAIPSVYKNILPIWSDTNLDSLGRSLQSRLWLANVRGATPGQGINEANTQPFIKDALIFTHNGSLQPFDSAIKTSLLDLIPNNIRAGISGDSDSQYLFALLQKHLSTQKSLMNAIANTVNDLTSVCDDTITALLNFIISDGDNLYACRHAINAACPSLYYLFKDGAVWIASEPLSPQQNWLEFNEHNLIRFSHAEVIETIQL